MTDQPPLLKSAQIAIDAIRSAMISWMSVTNNIPLGGSQTLIPAYSQTQQSAQA